jgi:hypothetical protein
MDKSRFPKRDHQLSVRHAPGEETAPVSRWSYRWYLSAACVREYAAIARLPLDDGGPQWAAAERELAAHCDVARLAEDGPGPRQLWRTGNRDVGGRKIRLEMTVATSPRPEGPLPQLVRVRDKGHRSRPGQQVREEERGTR